MALSVRPQFNTWDREGQARSTLEAQFGFGQSVAENSVAGFLSSYGIGTAVREGMTPQPNREYDPNAPLWTVPNKIPSVIDETAKAAGALGALIRGDKPEPTITEEEFAASPDWRKAIPYETGMTKSRLAALSAQYDVAEARAMMSQKEWGGAFIGQFLGQMLDPINYVPFTGPGTQAAAVARAGGILGRIGVAATDAAISTAVFGAATAEWRRKFGDDISFEAMAQEIGMSMVIGGVFGAGLGVLSIPADRRMRDAAIIDAAATRMNSLRDVQGRQAILSDSTSRLAAGLEMNPAARVEFERQAAKFQDEIRIQEERDIGRAVEARTVAQRAEIAAAKVELEAIPAETPRAVELSKRVMELEDYVQRVDTVYRAQRELVARGVAFEPDVAARAAEAPPVADGTTRLYTATDPAAGQPVTASVEAPAKGDGWYMDVPTEQAAELTARPIEPPTKTGEAQPGVQPMAWQQLPKIEAPPVSPFRRLMINRFMEGGRSGEEGLALAKTFEAAYANLSARAGWTPEKMLQEYPLPEVVYRAPEAGGVALNQSATIRRGEESMKRWGLDPGKTYKTREVATALEARQRKKYGTIGRDDFSPQASEKIAKWAVEEVLFEIEQAGANPERSAVGWYSQKFQRALDEMAARFPEMGDDAAAAGSDLPGVRLLGSKQVARDFYTALIAITSDGTKVVDNFKYATKFYEEFRTTGKVPDPGLGGGDRNASYRANLANLQRLIDETGNADIAAGFLRLDTVGNLKRMAQEAGHTFTTQYKVDVLMPYSAVVFGPKLGAFYANLMGHSGFLTMDRWWSRTFNRYRGQLITTPSRQGLDRLKRLVVEDRRLNRDPADISDDEVLVWATEYASSYKDKGFKDGTEIEKAANTLYKAAFENTEDQPFNASDRSFMIATAQRVQKKLAKQGHQLTIADIQAVLWYYEKRLYGELGARQTQDISYEEIARNIAAGNDDFGGPAARGDGEPGREGSLNPEDGEGDALGLAGDAPDPVFNQGAVDRAPPPADSVDAAARRYIGGLSIEQSKANQGVDFKPGDADMAALRARLEARIGAGGEVRAAKALSTEGRYGDVERSVDLEVRTDASYDPTPLWKHMVSEAALAKQDSVFLAREIDALDDIDPVLHTPGVELLFDTPVTRAELDARLEELKKYDVEYLTVMVGGEPKTPGAMPDAIGIRMLHMPEFERRYGGEDISGMDDAALGDYIDARALAMTRQVHEVTSKIPGMTGRVAWFDTNTAFGADYGRIIGDGADVQPTGVAEEGAGAAGGGVWRGQSVRERLAAADRHMAYAAQREADAGGGDSGPASDQLIFEQPAYHGSPHIFDRFEWSDKTRGKGEGAQAFGDGLYFAGAKEVAQYYRDALAGDGLKFPDGTIMQVRTRGDVEAVSSRIWEMLDERGYAVSESDIFNAFDEGDQSVVDPLDAAIAFMDKEAAAYRKDAEEFARGQLSADPRAAQKADRAKGVADALRSLVGEVAPSKGRLYKVDIPHDDELMMWDQTLRQQPPAVIEKLRSIPGVNEMFARLNAEDAQLLADLGETVTSTSDIPPMTGSEFYYKLGGMLTGRSDRITLDRGHSQDVAASKALHDAGIPGHRFLDQGSRNPQALANAKGSLAVWETALKKTPDDAYIKGEVEALRAEVAKLEEGLSYNYVIYDDSRVNILDYEQSVRDDATLWEPDTGRNMDETPRGQIKFKDGKSLMTLFDGADPSTALHEAGHHFLMMIKDMGERTDTGPGIKEDWAQVKGWLAVNAKDVATEAGNDVTPDDVLAVLNRNTSGDKMKDIAINRGIHEQWARGFEAYHLEGKAPSAGMRGVFESFRKWLAAIYASVKSLNVNLTPEIRQVFDRLLTDDPTVERAVVTAPERPATAMNLDPPQPELPDAPLVEAGARAGKSEDVAGFEEQIGAKVDGTYNEEGDIDMLRSLGRVLPEEEAALKQADDGYKDAVAYEKAIQVALACVIP